MLMKKEDKEKLKKYNIKTFDSINITSIYFDSSYTIEECEEILYKCNLYNECIYIETEEIQKRHIFHYKP